MERYICVHGHFYQPPRENPWLEHIEFQDSAYPYHDWNERITAECYAPNAASRILDEQGRIEHIGNNYSQMSFNFGPTLLAWMERKAPDTYLAVIAADRESRKHFGGHGSAMAQPHNHTIMPLANRRDKYTQVKWGIRDFQMRFGRDPEGMWLPETAVDLETLDIMAELGLRFTVLAPRQAMRVLLAGEDEWQDVSGEKVDPTMAYRLRCPSGRDIAIFFYDGPVSRAVAFERLLESGAEFAHRLLAAFSEERPSPQLVHIATDGETYGHHHRFGDMALAYALDYIKAHNLARITNYGEYLAEHPPVAEVDIFENTSWSCAHGVERWRSDCGCRTGLHPGWNQAWRAPLREALDWLRDTIAPLYEKKARRLLRDPWAARDGYVGVLLDRSQPSVRRFLEKHSSRALDPAETVTVLKLLEMQRHAMLMFTSCAWFFDELSGIETVQVLQYAGRALQLAEETLDADVVGAHGVRPDAGRAQQLAQETLGEDLVGAHGVRPDAGRARQSAQGSLGSHLERQFLDLLEKAKSNLPEQGNGRQVYERYVRPARVGLAQVAAHYAVSSLFEEFPAQTRVYCYDVDVEDCQRLRAGPASLAVGRVKVTSQVTWESGLLAFGALHLGDQSLNAGVAQDRGDDAYRAMVQEVTESFAGAGLPEVIRALDKHFAGSVYSLKSLFRDDQRRVLEHLLGQTLGEVEAEYRKLYVRLQPLMLSLANAGFPLPRAFVSAAEVILNAGLREALGSVPIDAARVSRLLEEAKRWSVNLDTRGLSYVSGLAVEKSAAQFAAHPKDASLLDSLATAVELARSLPFEVPLWKAQNLFYEVIQTTYQGMRRNAQRNDRVAQEWLARFSALGDRLTIRMP